MKTAEQTVTPANEFKDVLFDLSKEVRARGNDLATFLQKQVVDDCIDLWDNVSKAGGWTPGMTLVDAYNRFIDQVQKRNRTALGGERPALDEVLMYALMALGK